MRCIVMALAVCSLVAVSGCSCVSQMERANLTSLESRQHYISSHPIGPFNANVANGEIVRGMSIYDVVASWGLPNVYVVSRQEPRERWIYYLLDESSNSILEYTLVFAEDSLKDWSVDQRRLASQGIITQVDPRRFLPEPVEEPGAPKR